MSAALFKRLLFVAFTSIIFIKANAENNIASAAIFVYTPTSGQVLLSGNTADITWSNGSGASTSYYIDYSTDYAVSFTFVSYHTANTTVASFTWNVPYTPSTQCFIRIRKTNDLTANGISPVFTISSPPPSITLVNPLGGQNYNAGGLVNIIWGSYGFNQLDILFSSDGGTTWSMVAQGQFTSASYYTWTVPSMVSSTCKIRIRSSSDTTLTAQSTSNFSIIIPNITVNVPNGGQNWAANTAHTIYWSSTTLSGTNVNVEYSIDSGATWQGVAYGIYNIGSRSWTVPNTPSTKCFVKVSDASNPNTFDISNATFTITALPGTISLYTFVNSVFVAAGSSQAIMYTSTNITNVNIEYSVDGGLTWMFIAINTPATGNYYWTIPYSVTSTGFIRVSNAANSSVFSQNINPFTIFVPSLYLLTPNGGETLQGSSNYTISWSGIPSQYYVLVQLQMAPNMPWQDIAYTTSSGFNNVNSYVWHVNNISSNTCKIRIIDASDSLIMDESDNTFTINQVATQIYLLLPYGGQTFATNTPIQIQWSVVDVDSLDIYFSSDGGLNWQLIADNMTSTAGINSIYSSGYFDWTTPDVLSNNCIIKIVDDADTSFQSQNSPSFSITNPYINITNPNGGESIYGGYAYDVQFYNSGTGNLNLYYSIDNGITWDTIVTNHWQGTNGLVVNTYVWMVPNVNSNQCLIKVENTQGQIVDISNAVFTINSAITNQSQIENNDDFTFYPNPSYESITIKSNFDVSGSVTLTDILGKIVLQQKIMSNNQTISTSEIENGIYYLALYANDSVIGCKKVIIK